MNNVRFLDLITDIVEDQGTEITNVLKLVIPYARC